MKNGLFFSLLLGSCISSAFMKPEQMLKKASPLMSATEEDGDDPWKQNLCQKDGNEIKFWDTETGSGYKECKLCPLKNVLTVLAKVNPYCFICCHGTNGADPTSPPQTTKRDDQSQIAETDDTKQVYLVLVVVLSILLAASLVFIVYYVVRVRRSPTIFNPQPDTRSSTDFLNAFPSSTNTAMEQDHHGMNVEPDHHQRATNEPDSGHGTPHMTDGGNILHSNHIGLDDEVVDLNGETSGVTADSDSESGSEL
ncbi:uncharacterized protein [Clytia hemisphaerica]|uniref:Cnidarian restricted protein n=1 Tax=Clytia hemisphaerica TaxID=252671 RepID=A0A7M5X1P5_9CNID|eukprot:TCONS_00006400-protein